MKVSDCCGVPAYSNGDCDTEDFGICPDCKEHCEYIEEEEEDVTHSNSDQMVEIMNTQEEHYKKLLDKFKQDPNFELMQEYGRLLMRHINTFTPDELKRYKELGELLKTPQP